MEVSLIEILALAYVFINALGAGIFFGRKTDWSTSIKEFRWIVIETACICIVGIPGFLFYWIILKPGFALYSLLNRNFQLSFFLTFWTTKRFTNLSICQLQRLNNNAIRRSGSNISDRIYRWGVMRINARNNYTHKPLKPDF